MIPLKYNVRNLRVRWKTTLMTIVGTGLSGLRRRASSSAWSRASNTA